MHEVGMAERFRGQHLWSFQREGDDMRVMPTRTSKEDRKMSIMHAALEAHTEGLCPSAVEA